MVGRLLAEPVTGAKLFRSVSVTTRPRKTGERQGVDYWFVSRDEFMRLRKAKKILEWTRYLGYYYGTRKDTVDRLLAAEKSVVLSIDVRGAFRLKRLYPRDTVSVFVCAPSLRELRRRLLARGREQDPQEIERRLVRAQEEMRLAQRYDYRIINRHLDKAVVQLKDIVRREYGIRPAGTARR
jgi:guanylate kinase